MHGTTLAAVIANKHVDTTFKRGTNIHKKEVGQTVQSSSVYSLFFSVRASVDRLTKNKSNFLAQKEMEYLQTAQNEVAKVRSIETCTLTFKRTNMLMSLMRQLYNFGTIDVVSNGTECSDKSDTNDKLVLPDPQALIDDYIKSSFPDVTVNPNGVKSSTDASVKPNLRESVVASFPIANSDTNYRTLTWEGKFRIELSDKHKVTEACCVNGIAVLDNKFIAICDSPHDCIQLFNGNYGLLEEINCKKPRGICTVSKEAFAVSVYEEPIIRILSCEHSKYSWTNDLKVPCKTWIRDIKQVGKSMYLLCDDGDIHRTNLKGKGEAVFQTGLGKHQCRHLCVSKDASRFYVSGEDAVICLDKEGKQLWKYCNSLAKTEGRGLALFDNHVFVSDWKNSSLIELTEDGKVANITKDIGYPYALFIVEGERFGKAFVTQFSRFVSRDTRRCVHVYRVSKVNVM